MAGYRAGGMLATLPRNVPARGAGQRLGGPGAAPAPAGSAAPQAANGNGYRTAGESYERAPGENGNGHSHARGGNGHGNGNGNGNGNGGHGRGVSKDVRSATAKEQVFEVLHVIFKRWRLIVGLFAVIALSGLLAVLARGAQYMAAGKVLITTNRADSTIQPTEADNLDTLKLNDAVVQSEVHLIQSRELLEQVVRGLALAKAGGNVVNIASAADDREAITARVLRITQRLKVTPIRGSNVIEIDMSSGDPSEAAQVVNRMIDEYLSYNAVVHGQQALPGFFEEQSGLVMQDLRHAEEEMSDFITREGIVSPAAEIQAAVTELSNIESDLRVRNASVLGTEEKLRAVRDQLSGQPETMKRQQQLEMNPVVKQLREQLVDRQVDQVALLRKYTENDRHVRDNQTEINELSMKVNRENAAEAMSVSTETFGVNPVYEARLGALLDLEAQLRDERARKAALEEDLARQRRLMVDLKQRGLEFDHLDQELQRQRAAVDLYTKRQAEAAIQDAMDQKKLVNVAVVQRPGLPLQRTDSAKIPLALAIGSGLAVSFGAAFGFEYLNRTLRFERDVERFLGLPVLGTVAEAKS